MIQGKGFNIINKIFTLAFVLILTASNCYAAETSLAGIDVDRDNNGEYKITLKLDGSAQVKKSFDADGGLTVLLSSTLPSEAVDIAYDNASGLNNVIVQKKNKTNTMISFEGEDIQNAQIYIKELSTGMVKPLETKNGILSSILFTADKKLLCTSLSAVLFLFFIMLASRPKSTRYTPEKLNNAVKRRKQRTVNTLRNKNLAQTGDIPSINSGINGSFYSARLYMTTPSEFIVNNQYKEEKIRKAS